VKAAAVRLGIAAALFAGWIGYLAYLALFTRNPVVLSRPQFLVSVYDVVGRVDPDDPTKVHVKKVLYPAGGADDAPGPAVQADQVITVDNLGDCRAPDGRGGWQAVAAGGTYLLPLSAPDPHPQKGDAEHRRVIGVPPSPGFFPGEAAVPLRVYPDGDEARKQYEGIRKPQ
jgi:hypothetical protein